MDESWKQEWERVRARVEERDRASHRLELQRRRIAELRERCEDLRREYDLEQADVERLRGLGFRSMLHALIGDKKERLAEEEREAFEAQVRLRDASAEVERRREKLRELEAHVASFEGAEDELEHLVLRREDELRRTPGVVGRELELLLDQEDRLLAEQLEVQEARLAGSDAGEILDEAVELLKVAARWGVFDIVGGGLIVTHIKHSKIDRVRRLFEEAGQALWDFEHELRDVVGFEVPEVELESLHVGLDYFLDGLLVDAFVQSRIHKARDNAVATRDRVEEILRGLDRRHDGIGAELAEVRSRRKALVEGSG